MMSAISAASVSSADGIPNVVVPIGGLNPQTLEDRADPLQPIVVRLARSANRPLRRAQSSASR